MSLGDEIFVSSSLGISAGPQYSEAMVLEHNGQLLKPAKQYPFKGLTSRERL